MKLYDNIQEIYDYVKNNEEKFKDVDIKIQMRYLQEVLTNRAGSAPNKQGSQKVIASCLTPTCGSCPTEEWASAAATTMR